MVIIVQHVHSEGSPRELLLASEHRPEFARHESPDFLPERQKATGRQESQMQLTSLERDTDSARWVGFRPEVGQEDPGLSVHSRPVPIAEVPIPLLCTSTVKSSKGGGGGREGGCLSRNISSSH